VNQVLAEIGVAGTPTLYVFNKIDQLSHDELIAMEHRIGNLVPESVFVSAVMKDGLEPLRRALLVHARSRRPVAEIRLPMSDGKLLAEIHRQAEVLEQRHEGDEIVITARVEQALAGRLRSAGAAVSSPN
jgi:GTP-binding protein HflX